MKTPVRRGPWLVALLVFLLGSWGAATTRFQTELTSLFPPGLASVRSLQAFEASVAENELFVVPAAGKVPDEAVLEGFAAALRGRPGVGRVEVSHLPPIDASRLVAARLASLPAADFQALTALLRDPAALRARLEETQADFQGALDPGLMALRRLDPLRLLEIGATKDGPEVVMGELPPLLRVSAAGALPGFEECAALTAEVRAVVGPGFLVTGRPAFAADISNQMRRDLILMISVTVLLVGSSFWLFYRSIRPLLWILGLQALSILTALAVARLIFAELNVIGLSFAAILLGVGMDYCILVYHHFARGGHLGSEHWRVLRRGIWFSALTTSAAFGVLYLASFPALRQLAVLVAVGLLATAYFATTLLATWLETHPPTLPPWLDRTALRLARFLGRSRRGIVVGGAVLVLTALVGGPWLLTRFPLFQSDLRPLRPLQLEAFRGQEQLSRLYTVPIHGAPAGEGALARVSENLRRWTPGRGEAVAAAFEPAGLAADWAAPTLAVLGQLDAAAKAPDGLLALAGGEGVWARLAEELGAVARQDFGRLSGLMLGCIGLLCFLAHRSLRLVALNLIALLAAFAFLLVGLSLTETPLTIVSLLCVPLLIGLVIDYSLHQILALEAFRGDLEAVWAHLGAPVTLTALAALAGFSAPMLSGLPILSNFGFVMDLGTLAAAGATLVLVPACYGLLRPAPVVPAESADVQATVRATPEKYPFFHRSWLYATGSFFAGFVPRWFIHGFARRMGALYAGSKAPVHEVLAENLTLLLGRRPPPAELARTYESFAITLADYYRLGARPREEALALVAERLGLEHMQKAHAGGRGALLLTAHLGLFELGGVIMSDVGFPIVALSLPEASRALSDRRAAYRRRWGVETIEVGGSDQFIFLEIQRHLAAGKFVAALVDRGHGGVGHTSIVRLPHGEIRFASSILLIALAQRCPVVPVAITRRADLLYRVEAFEPFFVERRGNQVETLAHYAQRLADVFVPILTQHPEQWYQFVPLSASAPASSP